MRLVVKLTDEEYELCKRLDYSGVVSTAIRKILNGTPLPKGCGRLIDADALKKEAMVCPTVSNGEVPLLTIMDVDCSPTIIEADKEGRE